MGREGWKTTNRPWNFSLRVLRSKRQSSLLHKNTQNSHEFSSDSEERVAEPVTRDVPRSIAGQPAPPAGPKSGGFESKDRVFLGPRTHRSCSLIFQVPRGFGWIWMDLGSSRTGGWQHWEAMFSVKRKVTGFSAATHFPSGPRRRVAR